MKADLLLSEKFGIKSPSVGFSPTKCNNVVVYTRVSSKEQADKNLSLETQRKVIEDHVSRAGQNIVAYFGGTYESAKTDGRKEFQRMLDFIKHQKGNINQIVVYAHDRFSRTGGGAIKLAHDLRADYGVGIFAVTQPVDVSNPSGILNQNMQLLFSEYDNQERRKRAMAGMKAKFEKGIWVVRVPQGYDIIRSHGERKIVLNEEGKKLKKAWNWKLAGMKNEEIVAKLRTLGVKMYKQQIHKIFTNPFYCGMLAHGMLNGKVIEGTHEKMISRDVFLRVNNLIGTSSRYGVPHRRENDRIPLKIFVKCDQCGEPFTGYLVKKKNLYYYKCRKKGCGCNKRAEQLDQLFVRFLSGFEVKPELIKPIQFQLESALYNYNKEKLGKEKLLQNRLAEIGKKIDTLEEKYFIKEEMQRETYDKFLSRFAKEQEEILNEIRNCSVSISNHEKALENAIKLCQNLSSTWLKSGAYAKEKLQRLIFPDGIYYNKQKNAFRTDKINAVINQIACLSGDLRSKKGKSKSLFRDKSRSAEREGFEPSIPFQVYTLSRRAPSTTRTPLLK